MAKQQQLSDAQRNVLEALAQGDMVRFWLGEARYWRDGKCSRSFYVDIAAGTWKALVSRGWVEKTNLPADVSNAELWRISDTGRAALAPPAPDAAAGKVFCPMCGGVVGEDNEHEACGEELEYRRNASPLSQPKTTPALAPTVEHRVKLPTMDLEPEPELPDDPAFASDDPVVAPLLKAFQCEWLGLCDPYSVTLRSYVVKAVIEAETLQAANGHKPLWAGVMDVLADTEGWGQRRTPWHRKLADWTQFRASHFDPPILIEGHEPDIWCAVMGFVAGWQVSHPELYAEPVAETTPETVQVPQVVVAAPAARDVPQTPAPPPAPRLEGKFYNVRDRGMLARAAYVHARKTGRPVQVIKVREDAPRDVLRFVLDGLDVTPSVDVPPNKAWIAA